MLFEFQPAITTGRTMQQDDMLSCYNMYKQQGIKVISVGFKNQGAHSIAVIQFDGGEVTLAPGSKSEGATWANNMPSGIFDLTNYRVSFINDGTAGTQVDKLQVLILQLAKPV